MSELHQGRAIAIFGGGPAGLMAADVVSAAGYPVVVYEAMPTVARKFLLAGKSGLNLTHAEDYADFAQRYGEASNRLRSSLDSFPPEALRAWADGLGAETFVGTSGRVFPRAMKGSPLLRGWLQRLRERGVTIQTRHRWVGMAGNKHILIGPQGELQVETPAALLAFGGASWPRLGSDGGWISTLAGKGIGIVPFRPANCGFDVEWSSHFAERFAGAPIKAVVATSRAGTVQGEFVVTRSGIEGSLVYAHSAALRDALENDGTAILTLDLAPGRSAERMAADFRRQAGKISFSNRLRKGAGLDAVKTALVRECLPDCQSLAPEELAAAIKALPLEVIRTRPIEEAISSAGGIAWEELDTGFMLRKQPGLFVAGEMIDWEAPTGGYLLTACMATGKAAAEGMLAWLGRDEVNQSFSILRR